MFFIANDLLKKRANHVEEQRTESIHPSVYLQRMGWHQISSGRLALLQWETRPPPPASPTISSAQLILLWHRVQ
jgi:hypothetical protein